jgi:hypothetical protein
MDRIDSLLPGARLTDLLREKSRLRRGRQDRPAKASISNSRRNDMLPRLVLSDIPITDLRPSARKLRKLDPAHIREVASAIATLGFCIPLLVGRDNELIDGEIRYEAAKQLGLAVIPCVRIGHLSHQEQAC